MNFYENRTLLLWFLLVDFNSKSLRHKKELENVMTNTLINKLKRTHALNMMTKDDPQLNEAIYEAVMANWMMKNALR